MKLLTLAAVAMAPLAVMGPPRISVSAGAPGAPLTVVAEHHDGVEEVQMTARVFHLEGDDVRERRGELVAAGRTASTMTYTVAPPRRAGQPVAVVVRGTHGDDGPFAEALVAINGDGAVVRIEYPKRKAVIGGFINPKVGDDDIRSALRQMLTH